MTETDSNLPLEDCLLIKLPEVGIALGRRFFRSELEAMANEQDEVNAMLGMRATTREYGQCIRGEREQAYYGENLLMALGIGLSGQLSEIQMRLGENPYIVFMRTGTRAPWKVVYHSDEAEVRTEYVEVHFCNRIILEIGNGVLNGNADVNHYGSLDEENYPFILEEVAPINALDEKPFDPEVVSSTVVNLIKRVEARIS